MASRSRLFWMPAPGRGATAPFPASSSVLRAGRAAAGHRRPGLGGLLLGLLLLLGITVQAQGQRPVLTLNLFSDDIDVPFNDQTSIYFEAGATPDFDPAYDATKLPNSTGLNLASFTQPSMGPPQQLSINGLPESALNAQYSVGLFVGVPKFTTYTLQVTQLDNFATKPVYLIDALLNTRTLLALNTAVTFDVTSANTGTTYTTTRFSVEFNPSPLPVTLTAFEAAAQPAAVRLNWQTATEQESAYFAVERSADGQRFAEIGRLAAAGTSAQPRGYQFTDAHPAGPTAYYRLRQVDRDGSYTFSPVRTVQLKAAGFVVEAFPTRLPPGQALGLRLLAPAAGATELLLTDVAGRPLLRQALDLPAGGSTLALPAVGQWAPGVYLLQVRQGGQRQTRQVVRE